ncbi:MAG TPA: Spy/CpxP family protein refolding chaperone [Verrucomicrobiae bacterium]|jgi:Spy/CpxP family protein refolding chaperone|nr:Spy/CpxP family protein refolding chaperone [Verrucomicrobiae bacterium]
MKAHSALAGTFAGTMGGLALVLGMTLPAAAQAPPAPAEAQEAGQLAQAQPDAPRPGMGERRHGPMHGHGSWHRHKMHRFSLAGLALRHRQELALTPAQVDSLRKLGTDAQRDAIKRQADRRLAELDLRTMMMPDPADANKPRDLSKIETKVREIEKLHADGRVARIRTMEQSRQVLTPEQRDKLRALLTQRWQHRGPQGPGMRGMAPEDGSHEPAAAEESRPSAG